MSFGASIKDKDGKDLLKEFDINYQLLGLSDTNCPYSIGDIRDAWCRIPYKQSLAEAARDAVTSVQALVKDNLAYYVLPPHSAECPTCACKRRSPPLQFGFDIAQAQRFISIPLERVHRASGGY